MDSEQDEKNMIDLSGHWLVHFGYLDKMEGSRIITLNGKFDKDTFLDEIGKHIYDTFDEGVRKTLDDLGVVLVVRNMSRIG